MRPIKIQYAVWQVEEGSGYWCLYNSIADAVCEHGDGTRVYRLEATSIGRFKRSVVMEKVKRTKKRKKAACP